MYFVENLEMTHAVGGGRGKGKETVMLFAPLWRTAYKNWYVTHPLYLNTFETIEKVEPDNNDYRNFTVSQLISP